MTDAHNPTAPGQAPKTSWFWYIAGGMVLTYIFLPRTDAPKAPEPASAIEAPASHQSIVKIGGMGKTTGYFVGCVRREDLAKVKTIKEEGDTGAIADFVSRADCTYIPVGTTARVSSLASWSGDSCIRPPGKADCLWFPTQLFKPL